MPRFIHVLVLTLLSFATQVTVNSSSIDHDRVRIILDVAYKPDAQTEYERERCKLDLYLPKESTRFATIVWFHGGGLQNGHKADDIASDFATRFSQEGIAVASVNYRLSPAAKYPAYIEDAAAAVAFVRQTIADYGGSPNRVFVSGHSAGGYLTSMVGLDPRYLAKHQLKLTDLAGYIPVSGQMVTHSTFRKERGIPRSQPIIDDGAPAFHAKSATSPFLCIAADDDLPARAEENIYFVSTMKAAGHQRVKYLNFAGRDHGTIASRIAEPDDAVAKAIREFIQPPPRVRSPEIESDRKVTFRLRAGNAQRVELEGQWAKGSLPMNKVDNDVWQITVGPIEPGVWEYKLRVDGVQMIDPGNPAIKPMREPRTSILHLTGHSPLVHDFQDVPHGVVHRHTYRSKSLNRLRDLAVYTPPHYSKRADASFPTLYLQHGRGDNQDTWTVHGKAHWILDNLIAAGKAKPMVIVMMDGHAQLPGHERHRGFSRNTALFERDLLADVIPLVEANYRVQSTPSHRGIVGLSMGGGQSLTIGLKHADQFAWVGGFSSATPREEIVTLAQQEHADINKKLKLLWIGCGEDDFLLQRNREFVSLLKDNEIRHEWHLTEGNHSWPIWRIYLAEFLPRLFR